MSPTLLVRCVGCMLLQSVAFCGGLTNVHVSSFSSKYVFSFFSSSLLPGMHACMHALSWCLLVYVCVPLTMLVAVLVCIWCVFFFCARFHSFHMSSSFGVEVLANVMGVSNPHLGHGARL